jgi:hypothetical protein
MGIDTGQLRTGKQFSKQDLEGFVVKQEYSDEDLRPILMSPLLRGPPRTPSLYLDFSGEDVEATAGIEDRWTESIRTCSLERRRWNEISK